MKKIFVVLLIALAVCTGVMANSYKDGSYNGTGEGRNGNIGVAVTVSGGKITSVKITSHCESQKRPAIAKALKELPSTIVSCNGTDGVDVVSGATFTSKGICAAVADALKNAGVK